MQSEILSSLLKDLNGTSADIEASVVFSTDGLIIASAMPNDLDEERVGAMSSAIISLGDRMALKPAKTGLDQVSLRGDNGYVFIIYTGSESVLAVLAKPNSKLGLIFLDVKRTAENIAELI